jgi:hypothetical protein
LFGCEIFIIIFVVFNGRTRHGGGAYVVRAGHGEEEGAEETEQPAEMGGSSSMSSSTLPVM